MSSPPSSDGGGSPSYNISPSAIVGIVIAAAFATTIVFASVYRFCARKTTANKSLSSAAFALRDNEANGGMGDLDGEFWNPNRQRSAEQIARMKEVRSINLMYAWERGRQARLEAGEIRPTTMLIGRKGENRSWDEYTIGDDEVAHENSGDDHAEYRPGGPYYYNVNNPYARSASQQRLSHLAPPTFHGRNSYMSTGSASGPLPRQPSALLPPPINEPLGTVVRRSPLRHEYNASAQEPIDVGTAATASGLRMISPDPLDQPYHPRTLTPNPTITINVTQIQDLSDVYSPFADTADFETISLRDHDRSHDSSAYTPEHERETAHSSNHSPNVENSVSPCNFSRPREGTVAREAHRPSVIVTEGSMPQLQLDFGMPGLREVRGVSSVYDDEEVEQSGTTGRQHGSFATGGQQTDLYGGMASAGAGRGANGTGAVDSLEEYGQEVGGEMEGDNVKGMIQD